MSDEQFDFEAARQTWPNHWDSDEKGWPTVGSMWRARLYPQMRVVVAGRSEEYMTALVYWDGDLEGLRRLFTVEPSEHWETGTGGLVQMPSGIGPWEADGPAGDGRHWRDEWDLTVYFERSKFGGPDTMHWAHEPFEAMPFFEPIDDPAEDE